MRTKTEEKRQAIIDVAAATFGELGFERTSMSEICTRLGGSKATLYNYFASKEALFLEVMFQASEADFQNTMLALQASNDDAAQTLRNFGQRFLGLLYSPEVMAVRRLLVCEGGRANIGQRCWDMGPARGNAAINAFLQQGIERRLLRNADTEVMRHHLLALLEARAWAWAWAWVRARSGAASPSRSTNQTPTTTTSTTTTTVTTTTPAAAAAAAG